MRVSAGLRFPRWKWAAGFSGFAGCALHSIWFATTSDGSSQMRHLRARPAGTEQLQVSGGATHAMRAFWWGFAARIQPPKSTDAPARSRTILRTFPKIWTLDPEP